MATSLPGSTRNRLTRALDEWRSWDAGLMNRPEPLRGLGGETNDTFLVADGPLRLTLRLNAPVDPPGIDRGRERKVLEVVSQAGLTPAPVYLTNDYLVLPFVAGEHPDLHQREVLLAIGRLFAATHALALSGEAPLDLIAYAGTMLSNAELSDGMLARCFERIAALYEPGDSHCLCHNDLLRENLLEHGAGLLAIDWEYAASGDPAFDIAVLVETYDLGPEYVGHLLAEYPRRADVLARLTAARLLYALIEILWWLARDEHARFLPARISALARRLAL